MTTNNSIPVSKCGDGKFCSATTWLNPRGMTEHAKCVKNPDTPWNTTVPGDHCDKAEECFGMKGEVACVKNACTTTRTTCNQGLDAGIIGHEWCSTGMYCDLDTNQCKPVIQEGGTCANGYQCKFGLACRGR